MKIRLLLSELRPMDAGKKHCTQPSEVVSPSRIPEEGACNMSDRAKPSSHLFIQRRRTPDLPRLYMARPTNQL